MITDSRPIWDASLAEILSQPATPGTRASATDIPGVNLEWMATGTYPAGAWFGDCGQPTLAQLYALPTAYLALGARASVNGVQYTYGAAGWVATSAPTSNPATTGSVTVQRGGAIEFGVMTGPVAFLLSSGTDEAHWIFATGATPPTVTWPVGTTWNGSAPTLAANKKYEISVLAGLAVWAQF